MANKEEIGKVLKERLDAVDTVPNDAVWNNIEAALDKKQDRKRVLVLPLWGKIAGIAAGIALLVALTYPFFGNKNIPNNKDGFVEISNDSLTKEQNIQKEEQPIVENNQSEEALDTQTKDDGSVLNREREGMMITTEKEPLESKTRFQNKTKSLTQQGEISSEAKNTKHIDATNQHTLKTPENRSGIASEENTRQIIDTTRSLQPNNTTKQLVKKNTNVRIASEEHKEINNHESLTRPRDTVFIGKIDTQVTTFEKNDKHNSPIVDSVKTQNAVVENEKDLLKIIEDNNKIDDSINKTPNRANRWAVATQVAPVVYGSFSQGSALGASFNESDKSAPVNVSYGLKVQYAISDKLHLRTGIGKTNLSYTTEDVQSIITPSSSGLMNFDSFEIFNTDGLGIPLDNDANAASINLTQEIGYFEIPLEASFAILNKKFGVDVIGGISTFILDSQVINATQNGETIVFGRSKNLNDLSFSGTVGLGLNYNIGKRIQLNMEPLLKIPLNSYTGDSSTFSPYIFGVYSGLRYKF